MVSLHLKYLDVEILYVDKLDVKNLFVKIRTVEKDHIDRWLETLEPIENVDPEVEGIVDRIGGINKRIRRELEATLVEHDLEIGEWHVLSTLRTRGPRSPGKLAAHHEISTGAMTNRLDRLEQAGLVRRRPDPDDRRAVRVELTPKGRRTWHASAATQARKEAMLASALTKREQKELNALLRKLMLALEKRD